MLLVIGFDTTATSSIKNCYANAKINAVFDYVPRYGFCSNDIGIQIYNSYYSIEKAIPFAGVTADYMGAYVSVDQLRCMASVFGTQFAQANNINYGFPFLKPFYWQTSV